MTDGLRIAHPQDCPLEGNPEVGNPEGNHCVTWILLLQNVKLFRFTATTTLKCILYADIGMFFVQEMFFEMFFQNVTV